MCLRALICYMEHYLWPDRLWNNCWLNNGWEGKVFIFSHRFTSHPATHVGYTWFSSIDGCISQTMLHDVQDVADNPACTSLSLRDVTVVILMSPDTTLSEHHPCCETPTAEDPAPEPVEDTQTWKIVLAVGLLTVTSLVVALVLVHRYKSPFGCKKGHGENGKSPSSAMPPSNLLPLNPLSA